MEKLHKSVSSYSNSHTSFICFKSKNINAEIIHKQRKKKHVTFKMIFNLKEQKNSKHNKNKFEYKSKKNNKAP